MSKETDARKALLATQVEHAVVEPQDGGYFSVFVPGAIRERNSVQADSEDDAKAKVLAHLSAKIERDEKEQVYSGSETPQDGEIAVDPENLKVKMKATVRTVEGE